MSVEYTRDVMSSALTVAIAELPEDFAVVLLVFRRDGEKDQVNYIANCERLTVRDAMKTVLDRWARRDETIKGILDNGHGK
jgi:hypothetical protein